MPALPFRISACAVVLYALTQTAAPVLAGQAGEDADGLVRTGLVLNGRSISVDYDPALPSDHPSLLVLRAGSTQAAVRLGRIEGHRSLAIGTLVPDPDEPRGPAPDHDLWLMRTAAGWVLDARPVEEPTDEGEGADDAAGGNADAEGAGADGPDDAEGEDAPPSPRPARILLSHQPLADEAETLAVRLLPAAVEAGTLELVWGRNRWAADFEFVELPRPPRPERTSNVGPGTSLTRDSDLDARYRATALGSRNETALRTTDGARIQVLFEQELGTDGVDFAALESIGDGDLVELTEGAVIRLRSEVPLRFGDTLIPTDNLAPDFPGSYGLWLRASGPGWTLVFNNEPDSWGTQHDPAFDATEVDIDHTHGGPYEDRPLGVSLVPVDADEARLVIVWGQHVWSADFTIEP